MGALEQSAILGAACVRCGREADFDIADLWLCMDCYHIAGSTCSGVGRPSGQEQAPTPIVDADPVC